MLVYLSNAVYYLHYGKQTDEIRAKGEKYVAKFARWYATVYEETDLIPKFHLFQHFVELARLHGAACFWDSFNLERFLSFIGKCVTTTVNHMEQASLNFLTRRHCPDLQVKAIEGYSEPTKEVFKHLEYDAENYAHLRCTPLDRRTDRSGNPLPRRQVADESAKRFKEFLDITGSRIKLWRIKKVKFRNLVLTSREFRHRQGNRVRDCYVCLDEKYFGCIADICELGNDGSFYLLLLQLYKRPLAVNRDGFQILFPDNNFPVEPTENYKVFRLSDDLFVQKALWIENVQVGERQFEFFALRANEWFEF